MLLCKTGRPPFHGPVSQEGEATVCARSLGFDAWRRTGGWPDGGWIQLTVPPCGSRTGALIRFNAGVVEQELAGGVFCKLHRVFKAHCFASPGRIFALNGGFLFWTSLAAPRSTWNGVVHAE